VSLGPGLSSFLGDLMGDQSDARIFRGPMFEIREQEDLPDVSSMAARWPIPFEDDDINLTAQEMWWHDERS